jgi:hypothetical protein
MFQKNMLPSSSRYSCLDVGVGPNKGGKEEEPEPNKKEK